MDMVPLPMSIRPGRSVAAGSRVLRPGNISHLPWFWRYGRTGCAEKCETGDHEITEHVRRSLSSAIADCWQEGGAANAGTEQLIFYYHIPFVCYWYVNTEYSCITIVSKFTFTEGRASLRHDCAGSGPANAGGKERGAAVRFVGVFGPAPLVVPDWALIAKQIRFC